MIYETNVMERITNSEERLPFLTASLFFRLKHWIFHILTY